MAMLRDTEKPTPPAAVLWTPWGPQKPVEREAQRSATRHLALKVEKLGKRGEARTSVQ
jgi:hypothetical protein